MGAGAMLNSDTNMHHTHAHAQKWRGRRYTVRIRIRHTPISILATQIMHIAGMAKAQRDCRKVVGTHFCVPFGWACTLPWCWATGFKGSCAGCWPTFVLYGLLRRTECHRIGGAIADDSNPFFSNYSYCFSTANSFSFKNSIHSFFFFFSFHLFVCIIRDPRLLPNVDPTYSYSLPRWSPSGLRWRGYVFPFFFWGLSLAYSGFIGGLRLCSYINR